jgi:predicted SprT family Zn-dependent metalloprotease
MNMMTKQYVTVDEAKAEATRVFNETMKKWNAFCAKNGVKVNTAAFSANMICWKKFGFRTAGRATRVGSFNPILGIEMNTNYLYSADACRFIKDTLVHEIAHCIAFQYDGSWGHDKTWKTVARILGDDAARCHDYATPSNKPVKATVTRTRKRTKFVCNKCKRIHNLTDLMISRCKKGGYSCQCGNSTENFVK